ncbi:MAG TPA: FtsW/RodA/SpoVE family cell cycle protein, partial [Mobilitalea sp.]|nr:FtsW/RodA/SpoVE family cell cycle protein [Mobilitalea sp.]
MFNFKQYDFKRYSISLVIIVLILGLIGAFLISKVQAEGENLYIKHLIGIAGGLVIAVIVSLIDYHFMASFYIILYIVNLVLLVMVKFMGSTLNYSQRWLVIGPIQFQPSELS